MTIETFQFEKIYNFRDMGGLTTIDGYTVKKGMLFRSGELVHATAKDINRLETLQLKVIFDYRDESEAKLNSSPLLDNVKNLRVPARIEDSILPTVNIEELLKSDIFLQSNVFGQFYSEIVFNNPSYQRLLNIICAGEAPLLHHCSAGKDRTGVGSALIYLLLDVPEEQIITDYLRTNDEMQSNPPEWFKVMEEQMKERAEVFQAFSNANEEYIQELFSAIKSRYTNYDTFFENEYGITKEMKEQAREYYLT
ncbi:tyrosine-protein phosphatase [Bacillus sp. FJAT-42315]|uniref:tyrosine-protein phosphatase n=1 Tax=Bacillus sp. FJAT-42315 TaxID=2014077 RepID=UPI000C24959C|nr:tyrosine-protein phosphatase [Bacillus sp. FJAT-42315]